ncbi:MAG: FKBP-type peptidyl-prolyl cis-trans isomerase [Alistipes sp.]|nr:FKBP-type peptidyl-prolyl cis-trans isomerase [Alistipes sp.]
MIKKLAILALVVLLFAGCKQEDTVLTKQQDSTVRYLESSHNPRLISEKAAAESLEEFPHYYTNYGNLAWRYIATTYEAGRESWTEADGNDVVEISFDAYVFNFTTPSPTNLFWSNRQSSIDRFVQGNKYFDPQYWSTDPYVIRLDSEDGMPGLRRALVGCREGDTVEIYLTYEAAYGDQIIGVVPKQSALAWYLTVEKVTKK